MALSDQIKTPAQVVGAVGGGGSGGGFTPGGTTSQILLGDGSAADNVPAGAFDNLSAADIPALSTDKLTSGTLPVGRGGTGLTALGTALHGLRVNAAGNALEYAATIVTAVACSAKVGSDQLILINTYTEVGCTSETFDTDTIHDNSTNNHRFTVPTGKGGVWRFVANLQTTQAGNSIMELYVTKNGTRGDQLNDDAWAGVPHTAVICSLHSLSAGDYISLQVRSTSTAFTVKAASFFYFERVGS